VSPFRRHPGFNPAAFLADYWQKKPFHLKHFVSDFCDPVSPDELAGLACEDGVESRLVRSLPGPAWQLSHGPIPESAYSDLGDKDWTLLVQAVDQWDQDVAGLKRLFDFLPAWRLEDIMVSFAAIDGGVGAHFDYYDVFLLQGQGSRRWRLGQPCDSGTPCVDVSGLSMLQQFEPREEFDLEPGDLLYVPAGLAHQGIGLEPGLCYSIGLRASSLAEALEGVSDLLIERARPDQRFRDSDHPVPCKQAGLIEVGDLSVFASQVQEALQSRDVFEQWFGCAVTRPLYPQEINPPAEKFDSIESACASAGTISRHPASRFAFMPGSDAAGLRLFVNGECLPRPAQDVQLVSRLCDTSIDNLIPVLRAIEATSGNDLVLKLINDGSLLVSAGENQADN